MNSFQFNTALTKNNHHHNKEKKKRAGEPRIEVVFMYLLRDGPDHIKRAEGLKSSLIWLEILGCNSLAMTGKA